MNGLMKRLCSHRTIAVICIAVLIIFLIPGTWKKPAAGSENNTAEVLRTMDAEEYLKKSREPWLLTGRKQVQIQGMMVSKDTSFHNDLEEVDYTARDDGVTVVLKGTIGEMWTSKLPRVLQTYTKPDGSPLREEDFSKKDVFTDLLSIPSPDSNYAMFVPADISVAVTTGSGSVLHTNLPTAAHGNGDYLICRIGEDGEPDVSDLWVLNGVVFENTYYKPHAKETEVRRK